MTDTEILAWCFEHFYMLDRQNATIHTADVRFSPITFRLAETLDRHKKIKRQSLPMRVDKDLGDVLAHLGSYVEDPGR